MRARHIRHGMLIGVLIVVAFWLGYLIWGLVGKARIAMSQSEDARRQNQALEERKKMLEANLSALDTEHGRDAAIRTTFSVARPGEEVIVVVPPATTTPPVQTGWWQKFLSCF